MPGTQKKRVAAGSTQAVAEDEPALRKPKQSRVRVTPDSEETRPSEPEVPTPHSNRQRKESAADQDPVPSKSAGKMQDKQPVKADESAAVATPVKRGRPRKAGKTASTVTSGSVRSGPDEKRPPNKAPAGDKTALSATPRTETAGPIAAFSPRRSGRSVVPNRRFQDMEVDFGAIGRKKPKEDAADAPVSKRAKASSSKKQSADKGKKSPAKSAVPKGSSPGLAERAASSMIPTASQGPAVAVSVSVTMVTASSTSSSHAVSCARSQPVLTTSTVVWSPHQQSAATVPSPASLASRTVCVTVATSPLSTPSAATKVSSPQTSSVLANIHSLPSSVSYTASVSTSSPQCSESTGLVSALSSVVSSTGPSSVKASLSPTAASVAATSVTLSRTVSITSSRAVCVQSPPADHDDTAASQWPQTDTHEGRTKGGEGVSQCDVPECDIMVEDLTEAAVEVEIADDCEQGMDRGGEVVPLSPPAHSVLGDRDRKSVDTPGRVVSKPCVPATSKSVFIVRQPPGQPECPAEDRSPQKAGVLPGGWPEGGSKVSSVREAGVGDVMSIVELSPHKKVPVVLAERKEHAGKLVKVISSQQIQQLPVAVQKVVSAQLAPPTSATDGCESLPQQPKTVTVHVAGPSQSVLESAVSVVEDASPRKAGLPPGQSHRESRDGPALSQPSASPGQGQSSVDLTGQDVKGARAGQESDTPATRAAGSMTDMDAMLSDEDESSDEEDGEEEGVVPVRERYVTSGTQTPYTKKLTKKVITVHVHPPSKDGGVENTEVVAVTKVEKDDAASDLGQLVKREAMLQGDVGNRKRKYIIVDLPGTSTVKQPHSHDLLQSGEMVEVGEGRELAGQEGREGPEHATEGEAKKEKYIIVDLPEGSTVKQPYVRRTERIDSDPDFYTVDEKGLFTCHLCQFQTYRRPNFYKHKKKHLGLRPYACDQCAYRAATSSNLKRHQEIHKDIRNHKCPMCDLFFRQKIHLERHIKYRHEEKKVKCPLCDYVCANENPDLKVHIKRRHIPQLGSQEAISAFKCSECGIVASSKRDLRQHLKFHSKGPELKLFCNMCSFVTDCESRLRRHQYIHTKEKPFQCGLCDYRGSQKEHVLRHMRTQHNIEIERKHRIKKQSQDKASDCVVADGEGSKALEKADYTSDEKIFACNHCNMMFSKLINLYKHLHTQHRDIMPVEKDDFACVVCDFRTSNKKNLLVHMRRHNVTDQSPPSHVYSCVLCRYMNPKRRNLFQHMRKKHHIEIMMREDGSSTCYVSTDPVSAIKMTSGGMGGSSQTLSPPQASQTAESMVNVLPLNELIATVTQPSELQVTGETGALTMGGSTVPAAIKMEDLALVVSNPHTAPPPITTTSREGAGGLGAGLVEGAGVETFTIGAFSQDDAAEAIQGLQALAQRGVLDSAGGIVEEQVQVMGSDDQTTLVIDPSGLGMVDQLVAPPPPSTKGGEALQVVEIDSAHMLDADQPSSSSSSSSTSLLAHHPSSLLGGDSAPIPTPMTTTPTPLVQGEGAGSGFQLSAEQLMNLSTGDYLEINGEMFKVEVSTEGVQGQQIISFQPAAAGGAPSSSSAACGQDLPESLGSSEVSLESTPELS
ncbi:uncharacterized protein LOC143297803 isoform X2 [Babylonia areolata]|uniref:uncharacterized protein LOC143297803 isoform X2 n=1 Tax=Babylonia areolata TaxID=304850 RepID=UPI003FD52634